MDKYALFTLLGLTAVLLVGCSTGGSGKSTAPPAVDWASLMIEEINSQRPVGEELEFDDDIAAVAAVHAQWLSFHGTQAYQAAGEGDSTPTERLNNDHNVEPFIGSAAETGCWAGGSVQSVFSQMNITLLTDTTYTHVGIGTFL